MKDATMDFNNWQMVQVLLMSLPALFILVYFRLGLLRNALWAMAKMIAQLFLIGLYLRYLFEINSLILNSLWLLAMLLFANHAVLKQSGLSLRRLFLITFAGLSAVSIVIILYFVIGIIRPEPLYDARYLVPIFGMILGNCMRGNVMVMERFFNDLKDQEKMYHTRLMLGATVFEAVRPHFHIALKAAINPTIATMATTGIVSLPGMMTGQILGGINPMIAIKYQIAIMIAIFTVMICGATVNLLLSLKVAFDSYGLLKDDIFSKK